MKKLLVVTIVLTFSLSAFGIRSGFNAIESNKLVGSVDGVDSLEGAYSYVGINSLAEADAEAKNLGLTGAAYMDYINGYNAQAVQVVR